MKIVAGILIGASLLFAACGGESVEVVGGGAGSDVPIVRGDPIRWESVIHDEANQTLTVSFTSGPKGPLTEPCNTDYEADLQESADQVLITVYRLQLVEPFEGEVACEAVGHGWEFQLALAEPLGDRTVVDGRNFAPREVLDSREVAASQTASTVTTTGAEVQTTTTTASNEAAAELTVEVAIMRWLDSVRLEPWYDGFQFDRDSGGKAGVVALDMSASPPPLPPDLPIRSVVSRMGQREWREFVPTLTAEMDRMGITGLSYDPFADTLAISRQEDASTNGQEDDVANRVRALLGETFDGIPIEFKVGEGDTFESPPTTR